MRFKKNVIMSLLFLFLFLIFLKPNGEFIVDSNFNSLINPTQAFFKLFYSWDNILSLGRSMVWGQSYIFPYCFIYYFFSWFFSISTSQTIFFALILWVGFYSFIKFIQNEFNNTSIYTYVGGFLYIFNLYTLTNFTQGYSILLLPYVVLPLQLYFINKILLTKNYFRYSIGLAFVVLFMTGINPPLIAINLIVLLIYSFHLFSNYHLLSQYKDILKKLILSFFVVLLINFYWISGILFYFLGPVDISAILSESIYGHNQASSYLNVFRTLGLASFDQGWEGEPYFRYSSVYLKNLLLIFSLYLLPLIVLSSIIFIKNSKRIFWVIFLIILSIPMVVATNQGIFARLYEWAYYNVPLFAMFRGNYKFIQVYIFGLAVLSVYLLINIKNIRLRNVVTALLSVLIVINAFPFFMWKCFAEDIKIKEIPSYYYEAMNFLKKDKQISRIFLMPAQYFAVFDWGKTNANPETLFDKSLIIRRPGSSETKDNRIALSAYKYLLTKDYPNFENLMTILNVKYIIQRNDFDWLYYNNISQSPSVVSDILLKYEKIKTFDKLDFYLMNENYLLPQIYSPTAISYIINNSNFIDQPFYFNNYNPQTGIIFPDLKLDESSNKNISKNINSIFILVSANRDKIETMKLAIDDTTDQGIKKKLQSDLNLYTSGAFIRDFRLNIPVKAIYKIYFKQGSVLANSINISIKINNEVLGKDGTGTNREGWAYFDQIELDRGEYDFKIYVEDMLVDSINSGDVIFFAENLSEPIKTPQLEYKQINPTKYIVNVTGASESFPLIFSESFHPGWKIYVQPNLIGHGVGQFISNNNQGTIQNENIYDGRFYDLMFRKPVLNDEHFIMNGFANSWWVDVGELEQQGLIKKKIDGTYDFSVYVEFEPQKYFYIGLGVSMMTLFGCFIYLGYDFVKRRKRKQEDNKNKVKQIAE
ncbi:MAG: alpha-(1-_3)-arabinofuranosyltransferase family protein [Patescibacteria group bacterium]